MDKLTAIKIKYDDGTYSDQIPISTLAENVEWNNTYSLVDILGSIAFDTKGSVQDQLTQLFNQKIDSTDLSNYVNSTLKSEVTSWLNTNVTPVGSAVMVDSSLSIEGAAADAKKTGNELTALKEDLTEYPGVVAELGIESIINIQIIETRGKFVNNVGRIVDTIGNYAMSQPIAVVKGNHYVLKAEGTPSISAITRTNASGNPISVARTYSSFDTREQFVYSPTEDGYIVVSFKYSAAYNLGYFEKGTFKAGIEQEISNLRNAVNQNQYDNLQLESTYEGIIADLGLSGKEPIAITETRGKFINKTLDVVTTSGNYAISDVIPAIAGKHYVLRATGTPNICAVCKTDVNGNPLSVIKEFQTYRPETFYFTPKENLYFVVSFEYSSDYYLESFDACMLFKTVDNIVNSSKNYIAEFIHSTYKFKNGYYNYRQSQIITTNLFKYRYVQVNPETDKYLKYSYQIEASSTPVYVACFLDANNRIIKEGILTYAVAGTYGGQIPVPSNASNIVFSLRSNNATFQFYLLKEHAGNSFDSMFDLSSSGVHGENRIGGYIVRNKTENPTIREHTEHGYSYPYYDVNTTTEEFDVINTKPYDAQKNILNSLQSEEIDFTPNDNGFTRIICGKSDDDLFFVSYEASYRAGTFGAEIFNKLEVTRDFVTFTPVFRAYDDDTLTVQNAPYVDGLTDMHVKLVKQFANGNYLCIVNAKTARDSYATAFVLLSEDFKTATEIVTMEDPNAGGAYDWHLDIKGSKAIVSSYGTRLPETDLGKVWYTEDNGETWKLVFQMPNHYNDGVDPDDGEVTETHIHGVMLDEFSGRMFVIAGESNRNIFWNDHGLNANDDNWNVIPIRYQMQTNLQPYVQVVNGYAFRDALIFCSDNPHIGCVYRINKIDGNKYSNIEIAHEILPNYFVGSTNYCGGEMFRRDNNSPLFLCMTRENNMPTEAENELLNSKHLGRVLATYDGIKFVEIWKDDTYGPHSVYMDGSIISKNFAYCTRGMNCYLLKNGDIVIKYSGREHYFFGGNNYPIGYSNGCCKVKIIKNAEKYIL